VVDILLANDFCEQMGAVCQEPTCIFLSSMKTRARFLTAVGQHRGDILITIIVIVVIKYN